MDQIKKSDVPVKIASGKMQYSVFGADAYIKSDDASMAYCRFSPEYESMENCCRENEVIYVIEAKAAEVIYGESMETMQEKIELKRGMVLRRNKGECCRMHFNNSEGYVECITFCAEP